jgi:hypothetical protein
LKWKCWYYWDITGIWLLENVLWVNTFGFSHILWLIFWGFICRGERTVKSHDYCIAPSPHAQTLEDMQSFCIVITTVCRVMKASVLCLDITLNFCCGKGWLLSHLQSTASRHAHSFCSKFCYPIKYKWESNEFKPIFKILANCFDSIVGRLIKPTKSWLTLLFIHEGIRSNLKLIWIWWNSDY